MLNQTGGSGEAAVKAAFIQFLRRSGMLRPRASIASELTVARQANRADLVVIDHQTRCFEVKTRRDTLLRLDRQLSAYEAVFDEVTVVAASKHINTVLSRIPVHVGIIEIVEFSGVLDFRIVRMPLPSPALTVAKMLDLMPAAHIQTLLSPTLGFRRRSDLILAARSLGDAAVATALRHFLKLRYRKTTIAFRAAVARRAVSVKDLAALKVWSDRPDTANVSEARDRPIDVDWGTFAKIGESFGPVPPEIRELLARAA